ncbi:hypothetical protein OM416_19220 [Paenibacillus sp. LS1]|uniref:hypothetical protein n=1 Tax=Paenibacillus sp. LS1 TaxID=2992120 RepID=UPI0022327F8A|nr:hypothetical protein [Paenibacillus sp. LS1]MCW3793727.1 hypothetical protein [Paenibacillus sp. LS1]
MPAELIIIIVGFAIPIIFGAVSGFTSNTMTQNNIPSMRDVDMEIEQEITFDQFSLSDPAAKHENLAMELPPLSFETVPPTGDQAFEQIEISEDEKTTATRTVSMVPEEVGVEVNRFFNLFKKEEIEPEPTIIVDQIQDQNNNSDTLTSVSEVVLTPPVERTVSVLPDEVGVEVNRFLQIFKKEKTEPTAVLEESHYVDQLLDQINSSDIPPPTEEDVAAESPLTEIAFRSIAKNYGFETASQITTTPLLGEKNEEDIMMGRIQFHDGETCLVYEDSYVFLRGSAIEKVSSNEGIVVLVRGFFFDDGFIVGELIRQEELVMQEAM